MLAGLLEVPSQHVPVAALPRHRVVLRTDHRPILQGRLERPDERIHVRIVPVQGVVHILFPHFGEWPILFWLLVRVKAAPDERFVQLGGISGLRELDIRDRHEAGLLVRIRELRLRLDQEETGLFLEVVDGVHKEWHLCHHGLLKVCLVVGDLANLFPRRMALEAVENFTHGGAIFHFIQKVSFLGSNSQLCRPHEIVGPCPSTFIVEAWDPRTEKDDLVRLWRPQFLNRHARTVDLVLCSNGLLKVLPVVPDEEDCPRRGDVAIAAGRRELQRPALNALHEGQARWQPHHEHHGRSSEERRTRQHGPRPPGNGCQWRSNHC
mmetsp:Transcript_86511/g.220467  ORF Transcript_86511/g.220467 Transcript_86511/m.220467 type:complete len:322 (+) Transcript_86511:296-1261(+)